MWSLEIKEAWNDNFRARIAIHAPNISQKWHITLDYQNTNLKKFKMATILNVTFSKIAVNSCVVV